MSSKNDFFNPPSSHLRGSIKYKPEARGLRYTPSNSDFEFVRQQNVVGGQEHLKYLLIDQLHVVDKHIILLVRKDEGVIGVPVFHDLYRSKRS